MKPLIVSLILSTPLIYATVALIQQYIRERG